MMKYNTKIYISLLLFLVVNFLSINILQAQIPDPVDWDAKLIRVESGVYELVFTAEIEKNWVVYSQFLDEGGPIATSFEINVPEGVMLIDGVVEPKEKIEEIDPLFEMKVTKYKGPAEFKQIMKSSVELTEISGTIEYMTCDNARCLPPKIIDFKAELLH